ncbi:MAG: hypothetical protein EXR90_01425 [Methyloglobulus sp.]|nr:hypothetical protein [Methyloglobulus sp.]
MKGKPFLITHTMGAGMNSRIPYKVKTHEKYDIAALLISALPTIATAEMKMQNSNPKAEPTLGRHMQNSNSNPEPEAAPVQKPEHVMQNSNPSPHPAPEHTMRNTNPKKFVSTNALSLEEKHSGN